MVLLPLARHSLLVVEDEALIAYEIEELFRAAGAKVLAATYLEHAMRLAEDKDLSAAVLDFNLGRNTSAANCCRLAERRIPFMFYSGEVHAEFAQWPAAPVLIKPVGGLILVNTAVGLLH